MRIGCHFSKVKLAVSVVKTGSNFEYRIHWAVKHRKKKATGKKRKGNYLGSITTSRSSVILKLFVAAFCCRGQNWYSEVFYWSNMVEAALFLFDRPIPAMAGV